MSKLEDVAKTGIIAKGDYFVISIALEEGLRGKKIKGYYLALQDVNIREEVKKIQISDKIDPVDIHVARNRLLNRLSADGKIERLQFVVDVEFDINEMDCKSKEDAQDISLVPFFNQ